MRNPFSFEERTNVLVKINIDSTHYYHMELADDYTVASVEEYLTRVFHKRAPFLVLEGCRGHRLVLPRALYLKACIAIDGPEA